MNIYAQYAMAREQRDEIDERMKGLSTRIVDDLLNNGYPSRNGFGLFTVVERERWTYSENLVVKESKYRRLIDGMKSRARALGKATLESTSQSLRFVSD